jgi:hypothetical protein
VANWTVLRAAWTGVTRLLNLELQKIDTFLTKVPNFFEGSSHNAAAQVELGGAGLKLNGATALEVNGTAKWDSGAVADFLSGANVFIRSGAFLTAQAGSTVGLNGTINSAAATWNFTGFGTSTFGTNWQTTFNGDVFFGPTPSGIVIFNGAVSINSTCTVDVASGGVVEWLSGAHLNVDGGAFINIAGSVTFDLFSTMTVHSGGGINLQSGSNFDLRGAGEVHSGATLTMSGTLLYATAAVLIDSDTIITDASATNRTGPTTRTGNAAIDGWRYEEFDGAGGRPDSDANLTTDIWKWNAVLTKATHTGDHTWRLTVPTGGVQARVRIYNASAFNLTIKDDASGTTIVTLPATSGADFFYSAGGSTGIPAGWFYAG